MPRPPQPSTALFTLLVIGAAAAAQADDPGCKSRLASLSSYLDAPADAGHFSERMRYDDVQAPSIEH